jgi:hypothetical protein
MSQGWRQYTVTLSWRLLFAVLSLNTISVAVASERTPLAFEWQSADQLRQRCDQAISLMEKGPPFSADQGDRSGYLLGIWMSPFFDLLAQSEQIVSLHPDNQWRQSAAYCQLVINLMLTDWHNGEQSEWLAPFLSYPSTTQAAQWQQRQLKIAYPAQWQSHYPSDIKASINEARTSFTQTLDNPPAVKLPGVCSETYPASVNVLHEEDTLTLSLSDPKQYINFMRFSLRSECRAKAYQAYRQRGGKEARKQLNTLLAARLEFAQQMHFRNWRDYRFSQTLLSASEAQAFISTLEREATSHITPDLPKNYQPWDRWQPRVLHASGRNDKRHAEIVSPSAALFEQRLRHWCKQLSITLHPINLTSWREGVLTWQLRDPQQRSFGEIYVDNQTSSPARISRLRYPVAGYQSGAMLITANIEEPQPLPQFDSHLLMAIFGLLEHPVYADYAAAPYPDLDGFEERIFTAITAPSEHYVADINFLAEVLSAKLAIAYHQHDLSNTDFASLTRRLLGENRTLVGNSLATLPYGMGNLAFPDVLSFRKLWQHALVQRIAQRYHRGELPLDELIAGLYQLKSTDARSKLLNLAGLAENKHALSINLAHDFLKCRFYPTCYSHLSNYTQ